MSNPYKVKQGNRPSPLVLNRSLNQKKAVEKEKSNSNEELKQASTWAENQCRKTTPSSGLLNDLDEPVNIMSLVLHYMTRVEMNTKFTGSEKKYYVLKSVRSKMLELFGQKRWLEIELYVPDMIENFIKLSRGQMTIDINKKKNKKCMCV